MKAVRLSRIACLLLPWLAVGSAHADIYMYKDTHGVVHITDRPDDPRYKLLMKTKPRAPIAAAKPQSAAAYGNGSVRPPALLGGSQDRRFSAAVSLAASRYQLDHALLDAVIKVESAYKPAAVSRAGAVGLMQLMPDTAERYGVQNPWDPYANIDAGARYLRDLIDRFGQLHLALAAYNAGEGAVIDNGYRIPPYPETQDYVQKVLGIYRGSGLARP